MTNADMTLQITDLPLEILLMIIPYLSPCEYLAFSSITPAFYEELELRCAPSYWRVATRDTFRVPNYPVVEGDGRRWMKMYRKMSVQTKIYGWGNNDGGCMSTVTDARPLNEEGVFGGPVAGPRRRVQGHLVGGPLAGRILRGRIVARHTSIGAPEVLQKGDASVVADLQCGGWSTTILDSKGALLTSGKIGNVLNLPQGGLPMGFQRLQYPPGYTPPTKDNRYDPYTAIKQFSSGRSHILGLSDTGRIWTWDHVEHVGLHVKFLTIDLVESSTHDLSHKKGHVKKVVAGFNRSTAYIIGTGIVTWEPSNSSEIQGFSDHSSGDGMLVLESSVIPDSGYLQDSSRYDRDDLVNSAGVSEIGEVTNYAVLESYILFVTHIGKVFAFSIRDQGSSTFLVSPRSSTDLSHDNIAIDVQGSFRSFAILKSNGEVLTGDESYLANMDSNSRRLQKIPSLQHSGVISMAFGDHHYHALHADGTISSYGNDPQGCGALGLGGRMDRIAILRGAKRGGDFGADLTLINACHTTGRRVWFEPEKRLWLQAMMGDSSEEATERKELCETQDDICADVSEWVEQKLSRWNHDSSNTSNADDEEAGLSPYFALSVAAAGWHSGALVLVDQERAHKIASGYQVPIPPRTDLTTIQITEELTDEPAQARSSNEQSTSEGLIASTMTAVRSGMNWFLGAPTTQSNPSINPEKSAWAWNQATFPRLRLRSGEVMPGTTPVVDWTGPQDWQSIEDVVN